MSRSLVFLVGSGASFGAGMPGVRELTQRVLSGEGVARHSDSSYYISPPRDYQEAHVPVEQNVAFLHELKDIADRYFRVHWPGRETDYEDLANLCHQLDDAIGLNGLLDFEDPGLAPLIEHLVGTVYSGRSVWQIKETATEAWHYINDVVRSLLSKEVGDTSYLVALTDACLDPRLDRVTLATLNHDLVLHRALENANISFSDGFTREHGDVLVWNDDFGDAGVRLLKLHGSVNWYVRRLPGEEWRERVTIARNGPDIEHVKGPTDEDLGFTTEGRPEFLTGTFTKILSYDSRIYPEQHFRFQQALRDTDRVVVVGYGFRDKAINSRLIGWLDRSLDNRLVVIERDPYRIESSARGAVRPSWDDWQKQGRMQLLARAIEHVSWTDIWDALQCDP